MSGEQLGLPPDILNSLRDQSVMDDVASVATTALSSTADDVFTSEPPSLLPTGSTHPFQSPPTNYLPEPNLDMLQEL